MMGGGGGPGGPSEPVPKIGVPAKKVFIHVEPYEEEEGEQRSCAATFIGGASTAGMPPAGYEKTFHLRAPN